MDSYRTQLIELQRKHEEVLNQHAENLIGRSDDSIAAARKILKLTVDGINKDITIGKLKRLLNHKD